MFLGVDDALETTIDFSFEIWFFFEKFWKKMKKKTKDWKKKKERWICYISLRSDHFTTFRFVKKMGVEFVYTYVQMLKYTWLCEMSVM